MEQENEAMLYNAPQYRDMRSRTGAQPGSGLQPQALPKASPGIERPAGSNNGYSNQYTFSNNVTPEMPDESQREAINREYLNQNLPQRSVAGARGLQQSQSVNNIQQPYGYGAPQNQNDRLARDFLESHRQM